jgi:hypothetical protein
MYARLPLVKAEGARAARSSVFQWARSFGEESPRCAYWIVSDCPNLKNGKTCARLHE